MKGCINGILMRFSFKDFCYDNQNFLKCFNKIVLLFYKSKIFSHYISRFIQVFRFKFELFLSEQQNFFFFVLLLIWTMDVYKFWKGLTIFRQLNINYMRYLCVLLKHSSYDFTILWHKKLLNVAIIYKLVKFLSTLKHIQNWALLVSAVSVELFVKLTQQNQNKPDLPTANIVLYKEREQNIPLSVFVFICSLQIIFLRKDPIQYKI